MSSKCQTHSNRAFSLLELIVVVGLVAVIAAFASRAFSGSGAGEIRQAESSVAGLLRSARSTAIRESRPARLVINLDSSDVEIRLATMAVIVSNGSGGWNLSGDLVPLPKGIRVVPNSSIPTAASVDWPANAVSRWSGTVARPNGMLPDGNYGYVEFFATGNTQAVSPKVVVSPVRWSSTGFEFFLPEQVRCLLVRTSGSMTSLQDVSSIP